MSQLFKKLFFFTDIHFGRNSNGAQAIQDNMDFLNWGIETARTAGCETCIFGGDFFDNRHSIHVSTLTAGTEALQRINDAFPKTHMLIGNHDLFYRDRRDVASIEFARYLPNIHIVRDPMTVGEVQLLPWLVGDEHKTIKTTRRKSRYTFAHLEMPGFMMNAKVEMPESAHAAKAESFLDQDLVFTGHFHMRQQKGNVVYTGNVMPFNHSDNWDADRGMMILEWGKDPQFHAWPDQPLFRAMNLSEVLDSPDRCLARNLTARITMDIEISYEEAQSLRDALVREYGLRKMELVQKQNENAVTEFVQDVAFQSVDQIVESGLLSVNSHGFDAHQLVSIYRALAGA